MRLTARAQTDLEEILAWTREQFGPRQAAAYSRTLEAAVRALTQGPELLGARPRPEIGPSLRTLHVARRRRRGRHFVLFNAAVDDQGPFIQVLRFLYDGADLPRHAPPEPPQS